MSYTDDEPSSSRQYAPITAMVVEALKEQQKILDGKEQELADLRTLFEKLEEILYLNK